LEPILLVHIVIHTLVGRNQLHKIDWVISVVRASFQSTYTVCTVQSLNGRLLSRSRDSWTAVTS